MTKKELIAKLAEKLGTKVAAENALNSVIETIQDTLASGEDVNIANFCKFEIKTQKGKTGKIPGTDKTYTTTDKKVVKAKALKALQDKVA